MSRRETLEKENAMLVQALAILASREPDGVLRIGKDAWKETEGERLRMSVRLINNVVMEFRFDKGGN